MTKSPLRSSIAVLIAISICNSDACIFCSCIALIIIFPVVNLPTRPEIPLARTLFHDVAVALLRFPSSLSSFVFAHYIDKNKNTKEESEVRADAKDGVHENPRETRKGEPEE